VRLPQSSHLSDIRRNPPRLVFREQLGRRSPARLILIINVPELLPVAINHDEGRTDILDRSGRREAAFGHSRLSASGQVARLGLQPGFVRADFDCLFLKRNHATPLVVLPWRVWRSLLQRS
jgi:hypothetical protein